MGSQLTDEEKVLYKESTYTVISLVAYLTYCFIDDFCTGNSEEMKTTAMLKALKKRLEEKVSFSIKDLLEECYYETRADYSDAEKKQFYDKYVRKLSLVIDNDGNVRAELGK